MTACELYPKFLIMHPEFANDSDKFVVAYLERALNQLSDLAWGTNFEQAVMLESAHNMALAKIAGNDSSGAFQGAVGPITSVSAAGISTSFATLSPQGKSATDDWYNKTVYGQQFLRLRNMTIAPGAMTA